MAETADPIAALSDKSVAARAAGARDLAQIGGPEHLGLLVARAVEDPAAGVRLGAAAAAADILSRCRLPGRAGAVPDAARLEVWGALRGFDPGGNPGVFQVCGTLGVPAAIDRILGALRDPRVDVRQGACVGLWRLCASAAVNGDVALEERVVGLFSDARIRPDTLAELARVVSLVGYTRAIPAVRALAESAQRQNAVVAAEALQRLEWSAPLAGFWTSLGMDAGEAGAAAEDGAVLALTGSDALLRAAPGSVTRESVGAPLRRLWLKRPDGGEAGWAIQMNAETCWIATPDEVATFGDRFLAADAFAHFDLVEPLLPVSAGAARLRGVALLRAGDAEGARAHLAAAVEMKKVPVDVWWFLAEAHRALGQDAEARPHLEKYLARAGKRGAWVAEARERLAALGGAAE